MSFLSTRDLTPWYEHLRDAYMDTYEALGIAYLATLSVAIAGAFLQSAGLPRLSWIWIAGVLVLSLTVGLATASRRYR